MPKFVSFVFSLIICLIPMFAANGQSNISEITTSFKVGDTTFTIERFGDEVLPDRYVLKLNNKNLAVIEDRFVGVEGYFDLIDLRKVVIVSRAGGGNACPKELLIVSFDDEGLSAVTPTFGNCSEAPTFIVKTDSLTINFPFRNVPISESWTYDKYGLRQTKKPQPKRKK